MTERMRLTREDVLLFHRGLLDERLADDPGFLDPLIGKRLGCWCSPLACHGDYVAERLAAIERERGIVTRWAA